jgi:hypothetical protein
MVYALPPVESSAVVFLAGNYTPKIDPNNPNEVIIAPSLGISAKVKVETKSVVSGSNRYYTWRNRGLLDNLGHTLSDLGDAL